MKSLLVGALVLHFSLQIGQAQLPPLRGLSRSDLLEIRAGKSGLSRASTPEHWQQRRQEAIAGFQSMAGPLPVGPRSVPTVRVLEDVEVGSYRRRLIHYSSSPGFWVPAYLCLPKSALQGKPAPAVLCLHPTDDKIGHKVVVGLGGRPHRQYAAELTQRGLITLSPSYPLLANYQPKLKEEGFSSGTMKAVWDNMRGLDLLASMPEVESSVGFAAIGHSLGGHNAIYTAVMDDRIRWVVSSCGFDSFLDYKGGNVTGWVQERYMMRMGPLSQRPQDLPFDFYELVACLAPRRLLVNAPLRDSNFVWQSVDRIAAAAKPVYALYGVQDGVSVRHPDSEHDFPDRERFEAYQWIERGLSLRN
jgi:hypothetical protein